MKASIAGERASWSATLGVLGLLQDATTQRRGKIYEYGVGCYGTPADATILWQLVRGTTALGTSTAVTPTPLDPADAASILDAGENYTVNPTIGVVLDERAVHQRTTFRWFAVPGSEILLAATANLSVLLRTTAISSGTPSNVHSSMLFEEL